jgi:hypothetical protein
MLRSRVFDAYAGVSSYRFGLFLYISMIKTLGERCGDVWDTA